MINNLLTICIPTYNRPNTLAILLTQLSSENLTKVKIVICDDASPDNGQTKKVVNRFKKDGLSVTYVRNTNNLGYSLNVKKLYDLSASQYVWFLCDDDEIEPGAVTKIKQKLIHFKPTVAVFNCTWTDSYGRNLKAWNNPDELLTDSKKLVSYEPIMRTIFLSIDVFKKTNSSLTLSPEVIKGNIFIQVTIALQLLSQNFKLAQFSDVIVKRKVGYKYGEFIKFNLTDHFKAITAINHNFDIEKFKQWSWSMYPSYLLLYLSQKVGLFKYNGNATSDTIYLFKLYYGKSRYIVYKLVETFSKYIPAFLFKSVYFLILIKMHGLTRGIYIAKHMVNRAIKDTRKTLFTTYS